MHLGSRSPRRIWLPFSLGVGLVVVASTLAYGGLVPAFVADLGLDKVLHATMGFTLTALLAGALAAKNLAGRGRSAVVAAGLVFVPVAIEEYLQRLSPVRSSDYRDLLADSLGMLLAVLWITWRARRAGAGSAGTKTAGTSDSTGNARAATT